MVTLLEVLRKSEVYLAGKGVGQPRLQAEWLLAGALGCRRLDLYLQFDRPLDEALLARMRAWVVRRGRREPLQYIVGSVDFFNGPLRVDARALIPRPETEELLEKVVERVGQAPRRFLDLGTGSGAIAVALARHFPEARGVAVDADAEALTLARENACAAGVQERLEFRHGCWLEGLEGVFDLVVANPPYLSEAEWAIAEPEVREHEPRGALVSADAGCADLLAIVEAVPAFLGQGGLLALETGIAHHARLTEAARKAGFVRWESLCDVSGRERCFLAWRD